MIDWDGHNVKTNEVAFGWYQPAEDDRVEAGETFEAFCVYNVELSDNDTFTVFLASGTSDYLVQVRQLESE